MMGILVVIRDFRVMERIMRVILILMILVIDREGSVVLKVCFFMYIWDFDGRFD